MYRQGLINLVQGVRINSFACAKAEEEGSVLQKAILSVAWTGRSLNYAWFDWINISLNRLVSWMQTTPYTPGILPSTLYCILSSSLVEFCMF